MNEKETIKYQVYYPGGNTTALVFGDQKLKYAEIAKKIMAQDQKIEQVGFVLPAKDTFHLEMMGGEFCVNAASSAAFEWLKKTGHSKIVFSVSGFGEELFAEITNDGLSLTMPMSVIVDNAIVFDGHLVKMQGISYLIRKKDAVAADDLVRAYYDGSPAFGIINLEQTGDGKIIIDPMVWVKETESFVAETACGSGSIAACLPLRLVDRPERFVVQQPSGKSYEIIFNKDDEKITLVGPVEYLGVRELIIVN